MKLLVGALLASLVGAQYYAPLEVDLEMTGNTAIKATIHNTGSSDMQILHSGSFLQGNATEKVKIWRGSKILPGLQPLRFEGIKPRINVNNLTSSSFMSMAAGGSVEMTFDIARFYDLSLGGTYSIRMDGMVSYGGGNGSNSSTTIGGAVPVTSRNTLVVKIDGKQAGAVRKHGMLSTRTVASSDCVGTNGTATRQSLPDCSQLAQGALNAALIGSASTFQTYFKTQDRSVRTAVAVTFSKVLAQCAGGAGVTIYCEDILQACEADYIAYTANDDIIITCPIFYTLPAISRQCHGYDRATSVIHEHTHLPQVAGTLDLAYGYQGVLSLNQSASLRNADTYALYANAVYVGGSCA